MQVHYYVAPVQGTFNIPMIERRVASLPGAFRLADGRENTYVIAASTNMGRYLAAKLKIDPRMSLATQGMVTLSPTSIMVYQDAPAEILRQLEDFITWLFKTVPCRVLSDEGDDWTVRYANNPHALFVEEERWL